MSEERKFSSTEGEISYTLRTSKRARQMRVAVYCGGSVVVTAPSYVGRGHIERFLLAHREWLFQKIAHMAKFAPRQPLRHSKKEYAKYKETARTLACERVAYFNQLYGFRFNSIQIKNQKSRWGSCSKKGNLNFNYKIALLPPHLCDYIVVHELCHLKEFNHSKRFWALVAEVIPDYIERRKALKKGDILA